jgi:hypothetical protein
MLRVAGVKNKKNKKKKKRKKTHAYMHEGKIVTAYTFNADTQ